MVKLPSSSQRTYSFRNAAAVVFALTSVLPMLLFTYTLYAFNKLHELQAQLGLGVALFFSLIGGFIFVNLMGRLSELLHFMEEHIAEEPTTHSVTRNRPPAPATSVGPAATSAANAPADAGTLAGPRPASATMPLPLPGPAGLQTPRPVPSRPPGIMVPGLGTITAVRRAATAARRAAGAFDDVQKSMWQAEAQRHLGQQVLISVKNAAEPISGSLAQIAEDGVLLEHSGQQVAISYLRITNIERDNRAQV